MTNIETKIEAQIDKAIELCPFKEKEILKAAHEDLMRFEIKNNILVIGRRQNYFDRRYKSGWPISIKINYKLKEVTPDFTEKVVDLMRVFIRLQEERSWAIIRHVQDQKNFIKNIMENFEIVGLTLTNHDGTELKNDKAEYYIALTYVKETFLKEQLIPYYITFLLDLSIMYNSCLLKSIDPILNDIMNPTPKMRNICKPVEPKKGSQFFGTDLRQIDYSLSAHKDIFTKAQTQAKAIDRFCSINEDPKELIYWLKRYQNRPTFAYWQESLESIHAFSWLE